MKYQMDKKTKRELTIEALEILKKEGIDVTKIAPKKSFNGEKKYITLKDVRDDRIDEIIEQYGLDPDLKIGSQIYIMRTLIHKFDEIERARILRLGIKKQNMKLGNKTNQPFRNQIQETLHILEQLRKEGIDIPLIKRIVRGKPSLLKDIDSPETSSIIERLGLQEDFSIGKKINVIVAEYSEKNKKHEYHKTGKDLQMVRRLGLQNGLKENVQDTLAVLAELKMRGIDISSSYKEIVDGNGKKRSRYICEIDDENIEQVLEELDIPKYYLIGKRILQIKNYILLDKVPEEEKTAIKMQLTEWGLIRNRRKINQLSELENLESEQKELEKKLEQAQKLKAEAIRELSKREEMEK